MAHTVESLSKLLKKTPDQVLSILSGAGISGKTAESNISADERQILMSSLSKRSSTKSSISVSRKTTKSAAKKHLTRFYLFYLEQVFQEKQLNRIFLQMKDRF